MNDNGAFIGQLMQALIVLVPLLTVCYIALMGQVRKQIREDVLPVTEKQNAMSKEILVLEKKLGDEVGHVRQAQEVLAGEVAHIRKTLDRLETMVASLVHRT